MDMGGTGVGIWGNRGRDMGGTGVGIWEGQG